MYKTKYNGFLAAVILLTGTLAACTHLLDEQPRSTISPGFLESEEGFGTANIALYSHLRYLYGPIDLYHTYQLGTDETTWANLAANSAEQMIDEYQITASSSIINVAWGSYTFAFINTCNGIISIGQEHGYDPMLIAEARVFRAHDYFLLVQTYGEVPLDMGSGKLEFNTTAYRKSVRDSVEDVYEAIFNDLNTAIPDLSPARNGRVEGCITQAYAQHLLAKAYLTYAWWLDNNGKSGSAQYYQLAYDTAMTVINNSGTGGVAGSNGFGLLQNYYDVNLAQNDRNMEILFYVDRDYSVGYTYSDGGAWDSDAPSGKAASNTYSIRMWFDGAAVDGTSAPVGRANYQDYGRPWRRAMPTYEVVTQIFADKDNDSRYYGTFQTVWYANQNFDSSQGALGQPFAEGDTVFYIPGHSIPNTTYTSAGYAFAVETLPGKNYFIWTPEHMDREHYPSLWKLGPYNPDTGMADANAPTSRPTPIAKLSETYLIAAEAAVKGATGSMSALQLINVLRERAAYREGNTAAENAAAAAAMVAATPSTIDIDYILDERMRELYGEQLRWLDLVRTKKLGRAAQYSISDYNDQGGTSSLEVYTRTNLVNIPDDSPYYLRPIPQGFLDTLDMTDAEKAAYQNPGY